MSFFPPTVGEHQGFLTTSMIRAGFQNPAVVPGFGTPFESLQVQTAFFVAPFGAFPPKVMFPISLQGNAQSQQIPLISFAPSKSESGQP
jgi:hypothetical protein